MVDAGFKRNEVILKFVNGFIRSIDTIGKRKNPICSVCV